LIGSTRSSDAATPGVVSTSLRNVMPLKRRETSNLPDSVGGRVATAEAAAVGVGEAVSISSACVIVQRQRSSEIHRNVIATKSAKKMKRTIRRSVPSPSFRTRLFPQPGCNRDNNPDSAQDRHQPRWHHFESAEKFRDKLRSQQQGDYQCDD